MCVDRSFALIANWQPLLTCGNTDLSCGYDRCQLAVRANEPRNNHRLAARSTPTLMIMDAIRDDSEQAL
jgi:hypothetical protein